MLDEKDDLSWLARKADRLRQPLDGAGPRATSPECAALLAELRALGVRGSQEDRTLYHRRLPLGCLGCLCGKGSNFYVTGLCTRDCFFCFNEKPRRDEMVAHGIRVERAEDAAEIARRYGLRSVGLSGGEPLLFPDRVLALTRALRSLPVRVRVELYTNGDRADEGTLQALREAGVDGVRFNLAANGFDASPVERALRWFREVVVEVPVVPSQAAQLEDMARTLDELGVACLVVHELFACRENAGSVAVGGYSLSEKRHAALQWEPVAGGEEAALRTLAFVARRCRRLAAYYCSCRTQELISRRGLLRRARLAGALR